MAAVYKCDAKFSVCCKFGWLYDCLLLHLQTELGEPDSELQILNDEQAAKLLFKERRGLWCDRLGK